MKTLNYNLGKMIEETELTLTTPLDKVGRGVDALFQSNNVVTKTPAKVGRGVDALFQSNNVVTKTPAKVGRGVDALFQSNNVVTKTPEGTENTIAELQAKLEAVTTECDRLREKLVISFKMDSTTETQNLITLKNDIASGLEFEYKAFNESLEDKCNEDNFEAYRWTISRVFRTLTRLGVPMMA